MERPRAKRAMLWLLDRAAQLTKFKREKPSHEPLTYEAALKTTALAATLLFAHGQTTERTATAAERLGLALGVTVRVLPYWGELTVEMDGAPASQIVPAKPLGVDMGGEARLRLASFSAALDAISLLLIAGSATIGALVRRWLSGFSDNQRIQPLCAAFIAGIGLLLPAVSSYRMQQRWSVSVPAWCWFLVRISSTAPSTSLARASRWESRAWPMPASSRS